MGILAWIIFGAIAGWIASLIMKTDQQQGIVANVIIGILGAVIGGTIGRFLGVGEGYVDFDLGSMFLAVLGSCILLFIIRAFMGRNDRTV